MANINVKINGLNDLQKRIREADKKVKKEIVGEIKVSANVMRGKAINDAPADTGILRSGIQINKINDLSWGIFSNAFYSGYLEFGTKGYVKVPVGLESVAESLRGKGKGDYYDFLNAILDWVKRKGFANVTNSYTGKKVGGKAAKENLVVLAESIAFVIMRKGIKPHPFFFKQLEIEKPNLLKNIENVLKTI